MFYLFAAALAQPEIFEISSRNLSQLSVAPGTQVSTLKITWSKAMTWEEWYQLTPLLQSISGAHTLDVCITPNQSLDRESFNIIYDILSYCGSSINALVLRDPIDSLRQGEPIDGLSDLIENLFTVAPHVTSLKFERYFSHENGGRDAVLPVAATLRNCPNITSVTLGSQLFLSAWDVPGLLDMPLTHLDLRGSINCREDLWSPEAFEDGYLERADQVLSHAIQNSPIERLYFGDLKTGVLGIFQGLAYNSYTRVLHLENPLIICELEILGRALAVNRTLKVLSLTTRETLTPEQVNLLIKAFQNSSSLVKIKIDDPDLQEKANRVTERNFAAAMLPLITGKQKRPHTLSRLSSDEFSIIREFLTGKK